MSNEFYSTGGIEEKSAMVYTESEWQQHAPLSPLYLQPGTVLNGQYQIGGVLGHGGFGITYLAHDLNLNVKVAIKEYLPGELATRIPGNVEVSVYSGEARGLFEYGLDSFLEEARTLAQFHDNPGVVPVLNFFRANKTGYLVMGYMEGLTLRRYLEQNGERIPFETARSILMPVMDALRAVHRAGVLHRDISPDNIYITCSRQVKLLDFGAARYAMGERSRSLSVILKHGYAPEEQYYSSGKQGPWTDVYALGAAFYRAITGQTPPGALDRKYRDEIVAPSRLGVPTPAAAEAVLMRALAVRPEDRFQDVAAFQQGLAAPTPKLKKKSQGTDLQPARGFETAGVGRRIAAGFIDAILVSLFWFVVSLVVYLALTLVRETRIIYLSRYDVDALTFVLGVMVAGVAWLLYSAILECSFKQGTVGKMAMSLAVTDLNGQKISFGKAIARNLGRTATFLSFGIGLLWAEFNDDGQALHDRMAGCLVVMKKRAGN